MHRQHHASRKWTLLTTANTMRSIPEAEYLLMKVARDRHRDGCATHVLEHEVVWCKDGTAAMVYLYFGLPGDDVREIDVSDIAAVYYDLDSSISEADFDARGAARSFAGVVESINNKTAFRVY
jgi:hypothetical protein